MTFWEGKKILITGGAGFLGTALVHELHERGVRDDQIRVPRSRELDLRIFDNCLRAVEGMDVVIHLAAKVGGIGYNRDNPGLLFYDNIMMGVQILEAARQKGIKKCVVIGTVCAYPKFTPVPFHEEDLWDGYPEETNAPYGLAKKMLLVQAQAYRQQYGFNAIFLLPVNLYGPGDNFDPDSSHVIPALIKKFVDAVRTGADTVTVWGTGSASREFLYVYDAARGIAMATESYNGAEPVNLGAGREITIRELADLISQLTGFKGTIQWDTTKPDGQPRRCLDVTRAKDLFSFSAQIPFDEGMKRTIQWYISTINGQ